MIEESTQEEIDSLLKILRKRFSDNIVKYQHERSDAAIELANQQIDSLLGNENIDRFWTKKENDENIGSMWIQERDNDILLVYIYVEEKFRGKGFGGKLMERLDFHFENSSKEKIVLHVFFENKSAVQLYKTFGFSEQSLIMSKQKKGL